MLAVLLYAATGASIAITGLATPNLVRQIDMIAARIGMALIYGRMVWLGGTILLWPIGLYVMATGRLVLIDTVTPPSQPDLHTMYKRFP